MNQFFVAFIDILGFSEMIAKDCNDPNQNYNKLARLRHIMYSIREDCQDKRDTRFSQFSDSIVLAAPFSRDKFDEFLDSCKALQRQLFENSILCRGGVAVGRHYSENDFIFSEGLIEAYRLEKHLSRMPRIVVSQNLIDLISYPDKSYMPTDLIVDPDNVKFIDYISAVDTEIVIKFVQKLNSSLKTDLSISVREKYLWVLSYIKFCHQD